MDTRLRYEFLPAVIFCFCITFFKDAICQAYSWSVAVPLSIAICENNTLNLNFTYTPASPDPSVIEWSKQDSSGTFVNIATYTGGTFTPSAAYTGRVSRTGSTAEIAIQGQLTAADGGTYRVSVLDSGGLPITAFGNVIIRVVNGSISASCVETSTNSYTVTCSVDVSPPVTLQLKKGTVDLDSAPSASGLSKTLSDAHNQTFQCSVTGQGSECVTPNSADVTCISAPSQPTAATPSDPCDSDCAWNAVIILVVLLVVKIVTDVIFVAHRWGDKCKQIINKKRHILYRICFIQGIINSICGVVFIIIICAAYAKCLGEALAIAALVISIFVLITGLIYIVIFLCKQIINKKRNILNWICFVQGIINSICGVVFIIIICAAYAKCLEESLPIAVIVIGVIVVITGVINIIIVFVHPGDNSSPDHPPPSSLPPIPPSMASPRKPVPPSSTTARTLPSPTSDPASDSAVNPTVHLEPLSVEQPKKKKKKRKKRKTTTEAGGETSDQMKNPAGDSDE